MRVLICGLPGSGKTHFAKLLTSEINSVWFNADVVREQFNDWNYDMLSRLRQTHRMRNLADIAYAEGRIAVCDFVAPTHALRAEFDPDYTIFVNTIESGRFENTNRIFEKPKTADYILSDRNSVYSDLNSVKKILTENNRKYE